MAYWWVSQNKTFDEERAGNYLWAPLARQVRANTTSLGDDESDPGR
jgi:hypothetical protein